VLVIGGEELRARGLKYWQERASGTRLINEYGPTETVVGCCVYEVNGTGIGRDAVPIGRPIANTQMYVLDRGLEPVPVGVKGEIYIAGAGLARGYVRSPELTGERFIPSLFGQGRGERLYRTGDVGRHLIDGNIEYVGRTDNQVKVRGYRIELGEIQSVLEEHRSVNQSVVIVNGDERGGERLIGYVVGETGTTSAELRRHVRERLPGYMVPEVIMVLEEMPLTENGKVDRKRLLLLKDASRQVERESVGTRTPFEEIVIGIFEDVLKLDRVVRSDNFFEIGGHSLLATQVASRIRDVFGVGVEVRNIFEAPAVVELASRIEEAMRAGVKDETPLLVKAERRGQAGGQKDVRAPLSFAQQRLWFLDQLVPNNPFYNISGAVRLEGRLNLEALERTINEIVRRHEALRTRFEIEAGEPAQVVDEWKHRRLEVADLTGLTGEEREEGIRRLTNKEARKGFDLKQGPLLRVKVLKLEEEGHVMLLTMHHIVSDGWSMGILSREVGALYRAYSAEEESPLTELPIQYGDFAVWQREWLKGEVLERELEYWRKQLSGMEALGLPTDHRRPAVQSYRGGSRTFVVENEVGDKLRELSRREGVTLFMTMLGGFDVLMSRYSGQEDVVVGTDIANRNRAEIEGLIGFFVNQLVLRVEMRARESFRELMKRVREVCLEAYAHQDLPFEKLVEELQPERELSRSPLFQVKLTLHNAPRAELELEGLRVLSMGGGEAEAAKFDLTVAMTEDGNNLAGAVEYSRELFEEETIERLMNQYANVLRGIVEESERAICEVSLLSEAEREQIVVRWNETGMPYRSEHCIHELFAEQAELTPERMALIGEGRGVSYGELNRRANQLGSYLQGLGVGPEVVVGLCLERSVDAVVALLGVLKAGGAYLPLDPVYPLERVSYMLEEAGVGVVLTARGLEERLPAFGGQIVCLDMEWARISEESESDPESEVVSENLAYVIYTSGSTGRPKGVMVRHRGLCNLVAVQKDRLGLGAQSHVLQFAPLSFDASVWETFSTLSAGGVLYIHGQENLMPGGALERVLREDQITTVTLPPTVLMVLEEEQSFDLQTVIAAGEACTAEIVKRWARGKRLLDAYGPTEATVCASIGECEERSDGNPTIGRPIANTRLYILDREMEPVPVGVIGELYIAGVGVARGYMGRAELTAERFIPNSLVDEVGGRLYQTGDVARYVLDGEIEFIGRSDAQIKLRGYRVELGEIEAVLNEHLSVRQGVVVASEDGRGGKLLIGYVVGGEGADATALKSHLREKLPQYMAPEAIILLEEMPLTANGKIDRKRLASQKDWGRQPGQEYVDSRTPVEEIVVGIFKDVLEINRVGIEDNFFEIGGHSLLATQVISRVRNTFGVEIGVKSIFEWATVEGVASKIEEAVKAGEKQEAPPLVKVKREGRGGVRLPLSFAQQRLWFLDQLVPNDPFYNIPGAVRLEGRLDLGVLELVINEIVARHEVLRTRIEVEDGTPVQVIDEWESRRLERVDLKGLTREEREEEVKRMAREEAGKGFDLSRGPLLRVKVLELEEEEHVALFTMHHIVSDAWSMGVLVREVCALYEAMREGKGSPLEELEIQYADYAVWQREYVRGAVLEREVAYWKEQLKDAAVMELPIDYMRPAAPSYRGGQESVRIGKEASESLRRLSQREGATLFMALMAAFKALLMRYSGEDDVVVGTVIANRTRREVEGLIGFFVNTLVMRTDLGGNPSFRELIRREREVALGAYGHQEVPFEKLVEGINPERDLSRNALFQVMMALENTRREMFGINELKVSEVGQETVVAIFDLTLELEERGDEIAGSLEYSCDLYEEETIRRMARHYEKVVEKVIRDAEQRIGEIDLLSASERRQIVEEWNRTARDYPRERCLHELFEEQVERTPDQIAVIFEEQCLSYRELDRRANQLANYLRGKGVRAGALVGLCVERSIEMVMALLGVLKAGGAYVPLDPEYPAQRLSWMLEDAEVKLLLTEKRVREKREAVKSWSGGEVVGLDSEWEAIGRENEQKVDAGLVSENLAYVIYTSGSTGRPKGAQITHRGVVNFTLGMKEQLGLGEGDRILQVASLSFDVAAEEIYPALSSGATVILARREELNEPRGLQRVLRWNGVSGMELPAAYWHEWVKELSWDGGGVPGTLRFVIVGCELPQKEKITEWKEYGVGLLTVFGLTETTITNMVRWVEGEKAKGEGWSEFSIGRPIVNNQIYILNSEQMAAPVGVRGEIYIGGEGVGQGYQKRADLTAERFVPNPFERERGERLYRTGDLGRYGEDGEIEFLGRVDQQVKVRGYRIELGEIESVILEQEGVENAVAVVREVEQGDKRLVAYVVPSEGQSLTVWELREHLERQLPQYLTPSGYVVLERLPLTPNGKIDRQALPAPGKHDAELDDRYVAPSTPIENDVAQIFRDVLRIEDVGIYDDFFALGGHSLLVTQVISRINRAFQVELSVRALFDAPTVNGLVVAIVESQAGQFEDDALSQMLVDLEGLSEGELDTEARDGIHTGRAI
jgi:amino acid adenylation domain-containing protein